MVRKKYLQTGAFYPTFQKNKMRLHQPLLDVCLEVIPAGKTIVDIGCACGAYVKALQQHGFSAWGVDGTPGSGERFENVYELDLTSKIVPANLQADWGLCNEVAEHIPHEYFDQLMDNFKALVRDGLIMLWADFDPRGKRKDKWMGHVNPRSQVYVAAEFARRGWYIDEQLTQTGRAIIDDAWLRKDRLMVLRRITL